MTSQDVQQLLVEVENNEEGDKSTIAEFKVKVFTSTINFWAQQVAELETEKYKNFTHKNKISLEKFKARRRSRKFEECRNNRVHCATPDLETTSKRQILGNLIRSSLKNLLEGRRLQKDNLRDTIKSSFFNLLERKPHGSPDVRRSKQNGGGGPGKEQKTPDGAPFLGRDASKDVISGEDASRKNS
ncbi:hypothetical protein NPIL_336231 [Nephila pilipes]|uniref:Uncharacterized protein n=1 Tax=Nephila pilipes TaxID=299642 RepID=A0A8X6NGL5_NEPPI|nr:hypothetical protein NPIL_336231 [Nephila pilipes]